MEGYAPGLCPARRQPALASLHSLRSRIIIRLTTALGGTHGLHGPAVRRSPRYQISPRAASSKFNLIPTHPAPILLPPLAPGGGRRAIILNRPANTHHSAITSLRCRLPRHNWEPWRWGVRPKTRCVDDPGIGAWEVHPSHGPLWIPMPRAPLLPCRRLHPYPLSLFICLCSSALRLRGAPADLRRRSPLAAHFLAWIGHLVGFRTRGRQ